MSRQLPALKSAGVNARNGLRCVTVSLWLAIALTAVPTTRAAATLTASLDWDTITVSESATLTLTFGEGVPSEVPAIPPVPNVSFNHAGQRSQFSFDNGRASSTITHNYLVRAARPGDYTIPAVRTMVDGRIVSSQPLKLKVVKLGEATPDSGAVGKTVFLRLEATKAQVYLGEIVPIEIRLYAQQGRLKQAPQLAQEGFTVGKMVQQQQTRTTVGNQLYNLLVYRSFVSGAKTGKLTLGPATIALAVPHPQARVTFFGEIADWMDVNLSSEPVSIDVLPLPADNVPADFAGAVGSYSLRATVSTNVVTAGDPITVTVQISGRGPIESLALTSANHWREFKVYPPVTRVETTDEFGLQGVKTFEQVVIPENADIKELPPITFSFFDPEQKRYRTVSHPATRITVRPNNAAPAQPTVLAGTAPETGAPKPATDIVHIKTRPGALGQIQPPLIQQPWFLGLQAVPALSWFALVVWRRRQEMLGRNPRLRRQRQVARVVRDGVADLRRLAAANKADDFYALIFRLLQERLGERLDLPATAITEAVLGDRLQPGGVAPELIAELHELFQTCNQARYAPHPSRETLASLVPRVEAALRQLQRLDLR